MPKPTPTTPVPNPYSSAFETPQMVLQTSQAPQAVREPASSSHASCSKAAVVALPASALPAAAPPDACHVL